MLHEQSKRLAKQQVIFACIFLGVVALLAYYVVNRTIYATYDGYIKLDDTKIRALGDIVVLDVYKNVGDEVKAGDTLYSYILLDNLLNQYSLNTIPVAVRDKNDMELQARLAQQEIPVLQTRLAELRRQKASEQKDIYFGLTNNPKQNELAAEIAAVQQELRKQINKVRIYSSMKSNVMRFISGPYGRKGGNLMPHLRNGAKYDRSMVHYTTSLADGFVTDVNVANSTIVFKEEQIMALQHTDYQASHLGVVVYVPANKVKYLWNAKDAEVIFNDEITAQARLQLLGLRVEQIPKHLLSNFSKDVEAVVAYLKFVPYQKVPDWVLTNKFPVKVRVNKLVRSVELGEKNMYTFPDEYGRTTPPRPKLKENGEKPSAQPRKTGKPRLNPHAGKADKAPAATQEGTSIANKEASAAPKAAKAQNKGSASARPQQSSSDATQYRPVSRITMQVRKKMVQDVHDHMLRTAKTAPQGGKKDHTTVKEKEKGNIR